MSKGEPVYKRCKCRDKSGKDLGAACPDLKRKDGSWNPKHGTWYFALELPPGPNGKRRPRMRRGGFATRDEATEARDAAKKVIGKGADPSVRQKTGDYLIRWLRDRPDIKASTRHGYEVNISTYLVPLLGHVYLGQLTTAHITSAFATIREWNDELAAGRPVRKFQRHVGPAAMQRIRATLRVALHDAEDAGLIPANPAAKVRMEPEGARDPAVWTPERVAAFWEAYERRVREERAAGRMGGAFKIWRDRRLRPEPVMVWSPGDAGKFLDYSDGKWLDALFWLAVATGMRRGELVGLHWTEVNLAALEISVVTQRVQVAWNVEEGTPKSRKGRRVVHVDPETGRILRDHRKRQMALRLKWGSDWTESGLVFTREDGRPLHPAQATDLFERRAFAAHLPPIRLHDLRHVHGSAGLAGGVDIKTMQDRLGHSTSTLTRDTYTSVYPEVAQSAAESVMAVIPRRVKR